MATFKTLADGKCQARVKNAKLLRKPFYRTFPNRRAAEVFCKPLEDSLAVGIVPLWLKSLQEAKTPPAAMVSLSDAITDYKKSTDVASHDLEKLEAIEQLYGDREDGRGAKIHGIRLADITREWVKNYIDELKHRKRTPGTIKKHMGTMRRLFQWLIKEQPRAGVTVNPFEDLPDRYAAYNKQQKAAIRRVGGEVPEDVERDRRLEPEEELATRLVLKGHVREGAERAPKLEDRHELELLFDLGLESAMRLREMYTLTVDQVTFQEDGKGVVHLNKTKNGDERDVPLTTTAVKALIDYSAKTGIVFRAARKAAKSARVFPLLSNGDMSEEALKKTTSKISKRFRWLFEYAGIHDLHFHDLRHEAICRFFVRTPLTDVQISRISGHRDPRSFRRYASLRPNELAPKLW